MWRLIRAEFDYNKYWLLFVYFISIPIFIFYARFMEIKPEFVLILIMILLFIPGGFGAGILAGMGSRRYKEKRERFYALLPISLKKIGLARAALPHLLWITIAFLYWIIVVVFKPFSIALKMILPVFSLNGIFGVIPTEYMQHDVKYYFLGRSRYFLWWGLLFFRMMVSLLLLSLISDFFPILHSLKLLRDHLFYRPWGAIGLNLFGFGITYLSIIVFAKRKSYAE